MNRSDTITKISVALLKAQSEMGNAVKDSKNPFFKSTFATLNAVREATIPVLNKNGISVLQPTTNIDGKLYVETLLLHESGEFIAGLYEIIAGKQNDPQAFGAAVSYSRRYSLQSMLNIGAEDDDAESSMGRNVKAAQTPIKAETTLSTIVVQKQEAAEPAPAKKGFGVKQKAETKVEETTTTSTDEWS